MWQRHDVSTFCRKNGADRLARRRVATKLLFVKKENAISAKRNETRCACIGRTARLARCVTWNLCTNSESASGLKKTLENTDRVGRFAGPSEYWPT
jgi:hypothetical protein